VRISYANVASTLALVLALGSGSAYAAAHVHLAKNSVTTKQIKNGTIKAADLKKATLTGAQIKDGSLTGADIAAGSLGKVPEAATVDTVRYFTAAPALGAGAVLLAQGPFTLSVACNYDSVGHVAQTSLELTTTVDNARWATDDDEDIDLDVADGKAEVASVSGVPAPVDLIALAPDGTSLRIVGSLNATGASSCRAEVVAIG
jgi:hypothetical protein